MRMPPLGPEASLERRGRKRHGRTWWWCGDRRIDLRGARCGQRGSPDLRGRRARGLPLRIRQRRHQRRGLGGRRPFQRRRGVPRFRGRLGASGRRGRSARRRPVRRPLRPADGHEDRGGAVPGQRASGPDSPPACGSSSSVRIVGGLGVGMASVIAPAYIAEIAPARIRGRLGSLQQLAIVTGIFISLLVDFMFARRPAVPTSRSGSGWRPGGGCSSRWPFRRSSTACSP